MPKEQTYTLNFSVQEVNLIHEALLNMPMSRVEPIVQRLRGQISQADQASQLKEAKKIDALKEAEEKKTKKK